MARAMGRTDGRRIISGRDNVLIHTRLRALIRLPTMKRAAINLFLAANIAAIVCWSLPVTSPLIDSFRHVIRPYLVWIGLFQSWDMFAPAPKPVNSFVEAFIIHDDGKIQDWTFPRMHQLSLLSRYSAERYRKFVESFPEEKNLATWPDVARRLAWMNRGSPSPPAIVILTLHWSEIEPEPGRADKPAKWHQQVFYEYKVKPMDLQ